MLGVEGYSVIVELENREAIAGCDENGLKQRQTETSGVFSGHKKSIGAASRSDWEMENDMLKLELEYLSKKKMHLLKLKERLEDVTGSSHTRSSHSELSWAPIEIPKQEPYSMEERRQQYYDFKKRLKDLKITWSNTVDDVLQMIKEIIKPTAEEYPLLEKFDAIYMTTVILKNLRIMEKLRRKKRYQQLILEKIATAGDIFCIKYNDFKDAFIDEPNFDDEGSKGIFKSAHHYLMEAISKVVADTVQVKKLGQPVTEDMKKRIWSSVEKDYEVDLRHNQYDVPMRGDFMRLGFEVPKRV
ncbi:hypothetical protein QJS10_CPB17g02398 [Acorus calamus]|uniref:Uncharacterized protein n=1 Tax=Acorus calamus TaxID=4465 RepID=A0AAV9CWH5_ACOCL|nr:hypothetical protein QJS10_CPB17g02398 [Acorus calamus]